MFWDRVFALVDSLQEGRFSATVLTKETISATICKFHGGIGDEDSAVEDQGGGCDLDISAGLERAENTGGNTIGKTMFIHLLCQSLHLQQLLSGRRRLFIVRERVSLVVEERRCLITSN